MKSPISARVSAAVANAAKKQAELENVSFSAIVERALEDYLALADVLTAFDSRPSEQSSDELRLRFASAKSNSDKPAQPIADKVSDRLSEIESRLSQLESASQSSHRGRKGKRRR